MKIRNLSAICLALLAVVFCSGTAMAQQPLSAQEIRAKQIYLRGTSPSGKDILAYVGDSSLEKLVPVSGWVDINQ